MKPPPKLKELSLAQCQRMEHRDIELFLNKCGTELEWLDLSFCRGVGKMNAGYLTHLLNCVSSIFEFLNF